jgi:uncharacterized protein (DUF2336 family)
MSKAPTPHSLDSLVDLACRNGVDIRPTLLRVLTDLYVQKPAHTAYEETQYVELALGLIAAVDAPTRAAVTTSLRNYPAAPAAILRKLAAADAPTAAPAAKPPARREAATDDLVELFFAARPEERRLILANLDVAGSPSHRPPPTASDLFTRLETAALKRNPSEFGRILEHALGISRTVAERIVRDYSGEPLVIAARALGMRAAVLQRILLFLNPVIGQSAQHVYALAQLFDELPPQTAAHMVAIWQGPAGRARPVHEPAHWDDEHRSARSLSNPARRDIARDRDEQPGRSKTGGR